MRALLLALLLAAPAAAQEADGPVCLRQDVVPGFAGWGRAGQPTLAAGRYAALKLMPAKQASFALAPERPTVEGSFAGAFPLMIDQAGTYRIALSAGVWIDVIGAGKRLVSVAHEHGSSCSGIAKIVDFTLTPGRYTVQLTEAKTDAVGAMVIARP